MNLKLAVKLQALALGISLSTFASAHNNTTLDLEAANHSNVYKVHYTDEDLAHKAIISFHDALLQTKYDEKYLVMELTPEDQTKLASFGFTFSSASSWVDNRKQAMTTLQNAAATMNASSVAGIPGFACYETVEESFAEASNLASTYSNLAHWFSIGESWRKEQGFSDGYDLNVLKLTNKSINTTKPILFLNSAIHAREYTTAPLTLTFAKHLLENYGTDADITWILDHHEVHILLQANPDGRKIAEGGTLWRKNANTNHCANGWAGIDLNRNFTHTWDNPAGGSSDSECSQTYRGVSAASEPEVDAMENYMRSIFADRRGDGENDKAPDDTTGIHLDIHSSGGLVLWPWGYTSDPAPNGTQLQALGRKFAFFNGYEPKQSIGLYPTRGTSKAISYGELGIPGYTIELGTEFFEQCDIFTNDIVPKNIPMLTYAAKAVRAPYVAAQGPDVYDLGLSGGAETVGVEAGTLVTFTLNANDSRHSTRNGTESSQNVAAVEYYIDTPFWENGTAYAMSAQDGTFNETLEGATATIDTTGLAEGQYMILARAKDSNGVWGVYTAKYLYINNNPDPIPVEYCDAQGNNSSYEWISEVKVGSFTNSSDASGYSDFTALTANIKTGTSPLTLTPGFGSTAYNEAWKIFIDFNKDGDFKDTGEEIYSSELSSSPVTGNLNIPASAAGITTRMRVVMQYNASPSDCGSFNYGEVEDYTVDITAGDGTHQSTYFENTSSVAIPDNNSTGASSIINVDRTGNAGNVQVAVNITHTYIGDLQVDLISPAGSTYTLHDNSGGSSNNINQTYTLDLSSEDANGNWTLEAVDSARQDTGTIDSWSMTFSNE